MKTEIQETELYKKFKTALGIGTEMRIDDNPFVVECCKIAQEYSNELQTKLGGQELYIAMIESENEKLKQAKIIGEANAQANVSGNEAL